MIMKKKDPGNIVKNIIKIENSVSKRKKRDGKKLLKAALTLSLVIFLFGSLAVVDYQSRGIGGYTESGIFEFSYTDEDVKFIVMNQDMSFELPGFIVSIMDFFRDVGDSIYDFINSF